MVLPEITYRRTGLRRPLDPNRPDQYLFQNTRVHQARGTRRVRTAQIQRLPRSQRPPGERAARTLALRRANIAARGTVYRNLSLMNNALRENVPIPRININLTKAAGKIRLSRNVTNAITSNNLGPVVIEVWNTNNGNRHYMNPNTFKQFLNAAGVYKSPFTRLTGKYRILNAAYTNATKKPINMKKVMKNAMKISGRITKKRKKQQHKLIPAHLVGMPNTSGNVAFARSLA